MTNITDAQGVSLAELCGKILRDSEPYPYDTPPRLRMPLNDGSYRTIWLSEFLDGDEGWFHAHLLRVAAAEKWGKMTVGRELTEIIYQECGRFTEWTYNKVFDMADATPDQTIQAVLSLMEGK